jgi:SNF2 family DNA or RNA helicase
MKAGGVGLNLVAARTVFISDPWWNAAVEDQCVDRIHRIGQTAGKVRVRKFYVANSVEERIVELQKRKKNVATEVLCDKRTTEDAGSGARPTLDDFKILFRQDE